MILKKKIPIDPEQERYEAFVASHRFRGEIKQEHKVLQFIGGVIVISLILFADGILISLGF